MGLMLNREGQRLDLQEGRLSDEAVEKDTQGMCSEFGVEASAQAPIGMSMIDFNLELFGELCIHRFNHLANRVVQTAQGAWQLLLLVASRKGCEVDPMLLPEVSCFFGTEIGFIAQHL